MDIAEWLKNGAIYSLNEADILVSFGLVVAGNEPILGSYNYYSPDFYLESKKPWLNFESNLVLKKTEIIQLINQIQTNNELPDMVWIAPNKQSFQEKFEWIQHEFVIGGLKKMVPVVFETSSMKLSKNNLLVNLKNLLSINTPQVIYGLWSDSSGVLGLSPEVLVNINTRDKKLTTMALAGTHSSRLNLGSLLSDTKEINEHNFVIKNIVDELSHLGHVCIDKTYEWFIGDIKHLRTDIEVIFSSQLSPSVVMQQMHPTPALGVYPKSYGWKNLKHVDSYISRQKYGAPFGVIDQINNFTSIVAIRNMQWTKSEVHIGSGCGVVRESNFENEWAELNLKRSSVKKYLGWA